MTGVMILLGGTTALGIMGLLLFIFFISKKNRIYAFFLLFVFCVLFGIYMYPYIDILIKKKIVGVMKESFILSLDGNATVRFLLWSYLFFEIFLNNIFGIGLGTPMIPTWLLRRLEMDTIIVGNPYIEYTLGAHNSFITVLIRFGIIGIIPFIILYWKLINDFVHDKITLKNNRLFYFYVSFFIITGCALLNVVLESPIHASVYWGILGMLYKAKQVLNNC